jgi:hypothetical protein
VSVIAWPTTLAPGPGSGFGQARYDLSFMSDATGAQQDRVLGPPRWQLSIVQPSVLPADLAGQWQAVIMRLRGRVNHLAAWNFGRPRPLGTLSGPLTLNASAAVGAVVLVVTGGTPGATMLRGDLLQVGTGLGTSQAVMVTDDAVVSGGGLITLATEPPLRTAFAGGAAITLEKPLAYFKLTTTGSTWNYQPAGHRPVTTGMSLDLLEHWQ